MTGSVVFHPAAGFGLPGCGVRFGGTPTPPPPSRRWLAPAVTVRDELDRVAARRLSRDIAADLAHDLTLLVHRYEGETNDAVTRLAIRTEATFLLTDFAARRLVYDFFLESDEHTNPPNLVDAGGYVLIAWVKPAYGLDRYRLKITMGDQPC